MNMPETGILSVFGGRDSIIKRMGEAIKNQILSQKKPFRELFDIAKEREIPLETVFKILEGRYKECVTYELFEKLEGPLDLVINQILGEPTFSDDSEKEYWDRQRLEASPMLIAGGLAQLDDTKKKRGRETKEGIGLNLYLRLRAIEELAWSGKEP